MERKDCAVTGIKSVDADKGIVEAQFATYGELDHHNDVHAKGAFPDGAPFLVSSYNHTSWGGSLPVGKGQIVDSDTGPVAKMQFFLETEAGRETFATVKAAGDLQQWSYGFDIEDEGEIELEGGKKARELRRLKVHEVSPVLLGAGKSTRTLSVKSAEKAPESGTKKMFDQSVEALGAVHDLVDRAEEIVALRESAGKKGLSDSNRSILTLIELELERVKSLLAQPEPTPEVPSDEQQQEILRALRNLSE